MLNLVAALLGIALLLIYLGVLVWSVNSIPFSIAVVGVVLVMLYDVLRTLRRKDNGGG